ncbi:MAG: ATP-binding cassette domain-containing protein [Prevotellaceae bacterium]|jgi:phospholipid/cholesterol/gamma-HCH transport system ATP-binding protein|nr:ATP-binding cassette domain-containing protein [Prevotellaceae bacterium]
MITVSHIWKFFGEQTVLSDISSTFETGKANLIIGASGSGKTVLLKTMIGLHKADKGEIFYDSISFGAMSAPEQRLLRQQMGILFQGSALFDFATVEENIRFPMDFFTDWNTEQKRDRVAFCLKRVNLSNVQRLYPSELSGGMQKRVGIARAIALNPKYLFCDEPNSGLDPQTAIIIDELIYEITQEFQMTTIINTHDMNSVMAIGDKLIFIHKGVKAWEGAKDEVIHADCPTLNDFVFASKLARKIKENTIAP